jgi:hypothetical protein
MVASHPLQLPQKIGTYRDNMVVIGQPPSMVEELNDKEFMNNLFARAEKFHDAARLLGRQGERRCRERSHSNGPPLSDCWKASSRKRKPRRQSLQIDGRLCCARQVSV